MDEVIWQFEYSIECKVPKSFSWSFWTNVKNWELIEGNAVEWIKLDGPFAENAIGVTKTPGQDPQYWKVSKIDPERHATIEVSLEGSTLFNSMTFESLNSDRTLITQKFSLSGPKASN